MAYKQNGFKFFPGIKHIKLKKEELDRHIKKAKKGDQDSFEAILCHIYAYLVHLTKEFFIQGAESEDVFQEGAIKLINVIDKYDESKGGFMVFAQSSIRKHIITTINREMAKKRIILNTSFSLYDSIPNDKGDQISYIDMVSNENLINPSSIGNPLTLVTKDYEDYLIREISKTLSDMEQKVFVLRFINGHSYKEVAEILGFYKERRGKKTLDAKSIDNAIVRSRPKIKKTLERLNISPKEFNKEIKVFKKQKKRRIKNAKNKKI